MNSFNKTEAAVFSCRLCFLRAFPFISLKLLTTAGVQCLCGGCKKSPRTTLLCSHIFLVLRDHGVYMYVVYIWKWSSAHALGASVVWHCSLLLLNSFNKTEAAVFSCRLCFLGDFPFISLIFSHTQYPRIFYAEVPLLAGVELILCSMFPVSSCLGSTP